MKVFQNFWKLRHVISLKKELFLDRVKYPFYWKSSLEIVFSNLSPYNRKNSNYKYRFLKYILINETSEFQISLNSCRKLKILEQNTMKAQHVKFWKQIFIIIIPLTELNYYELLLFIRFHNRNFLQNVKISIDDNPHEIDYISPPSSLPPFVNLRHPICDPKLGSIEIIIPRQSN